jgi:Flp pilus assembly protein TadD
MRHTGIVFLCLAGTLVLTACEKSGDAEVERALKDLNAIDDSNLGDLMLNAASPEEAVTYFRRTLAQNPDRIDLRRGLAKSLIRAKRPTEAAAAWAQVVEHPEVTNDDRIGYADALIRSNDWTRAKQVLDTVPPTHETFERYRLEAMVADSRKDWARADSFYEIAVGLTTQPSSVLNNWGYSKLTRGAYSDAERLFTEALTYDRNLFTAKNNLVMARAAQGNYQLPVIEMTQVERAELLHTMALTAIKRGDVSTGKQLLNEAIETHPRHFDVAVRALRALEQGAAPAASASAG